MGYFPSTHWSLVAHAGEDPGEAQRKALAELLGRYAPALRAGLIARWRLQPCEADDLVQDFLAAKVVEEGLIGKADQQRGRFRTFLLTALDRFVSNELRSQRAQKRGNGAVVALAEVEEIAVSSGPDEAFDAAWAREVIAQATRRMRERCLRDGREDVWRVFESRVLGPIADGGEPAPYEQLARDLNLASVDAAGNLLTTAKRTFTRALRSVIGEYEKDEDRIDDEIRELRAALSRGR
jgi:RNA polymerase sigma-70 factor (ECF subfamily)